ncbi:hypothetical protein ACWDPP_38895, partial [Streptomyces sp. NPDC000851]
RARDGQGMTKEAGGAYRTTAGGLAFYTLAQRLSLTAGPLRLLDGDFPNRASMADIAEYNLQKALELVRA